MDEVRAFFDELGDGEWDRLIVDARSRVSYEVHRHFLAEYIRAGDRVLEIGAGPGRFTIELARLGARVLVTDISPVQLASNARYVAAAACEPAIEDRLVIDVRDLSRFADREFDAVLAYGGPLSYVFEHAPVALGECLRVTRADGIVVMSVMSTLGAARFFLPAIVDEIDRFGMDAVEHELSSGDTRGIMSGHVCRMFRWRELINLFTRFPCELLGASASNCLSLGDQAAVQQLADDEHRWRRFLAWELELCREPGALDGGTHVLFALRHRPH